MIAPEGYWDNVEHRQKFLLGFAEMAGFDPMLVNNWHNKLSRLRACGVNVTTPSPTILICINREPACLTDTRTHNRCWKTLFKLKLKTLLHFLPKRTEIVEQKS